MTQLHCSDCDKPLPRGPRRKGTRCKSCTARHNARSPASRNAVSKAMTRRWNNPTERKKLSKAIREGCRKPEVREARRLRGQINCNARPAAAGSVARQRAGQSLSKTRLGWLPDQYRAEYFHLRSNHKIRAAEARRIIEDQMEHDLDKYEAKGVLPPPELRKLAWRRDQMRRSVIDKKQSLKITREQPL